MANQGQSGDGQGVPVKISAPDQKIAKLLECPVCFEIITPPILLCTGGHALCNICREKMNTCPTCRGPFSAIRNRFLEDFLGQCVVQCRYHDAGCKTAVSGGDITDHLASCFYRPLTCPVCEQEVPYNSFLEHLRNVDKLDMQTAQECSTGFEIEDPERSETQDKFSLWEPTWIRAFDRDFFCFMEAHKHQWWLWVSMFGTQEECQKYVCSITVWNKEKKTEVKYVGKIHPFRTPKQDVLKSGHCLLFMNVKNFIHKDGIDVLVRIDQDYHAPQTLKGGFVESPVQIFGKKDRQPGNGLGRGSAHFSGFTGFQFFGSN